MLVLVSVLQPFPADEQDRTFTIVPGDSLRLECRAPHSVPAAIFWWSRINSRTDPEPRRLTPDHRVIIMKDGKYK